MKARKIVSIGLIAAVLAIGLASAAYVNLIPRIGQGLSTSLSPVSGTGSEQVSLGRAFGKGEGPAAGLAGQGIHGEREGIGLGAGGSGGGGVVSGAYLRVAAYGAILAAVAALTALVASLARVRAASSSRRS
jgi:hypothetical protein